MGLRFSGGHVRRITAAVVVALGAGGWLAWAQVGTTGVIHGCLSPSGFIRGIDETTGTCRGGDSELSWYTKTGSEEAFVMNGAPAGGDLTGTYPNPTLAAGALDWTRLNNVPAGFADGIDDVGAGGGTPEPWHEVGAPGEPGFEDGWVNVGSTETPAAFYVDPLGIVHVRGAVRGGSLTSPIFTLPVGYRPSHKLLVPIVGLMRIPAAGAMKFPPFALVMPDGRLTVGVDATDIVYLDGISFRAE